MPNPTAYWSISLNVECPNPNCGQHVDLLEYADFWDGREHPQPAERMENVEVVCPKCAHEFTVTTDF